MTTTEALPYVLAEVTVADVERLSPSFVRVSLGGRPIQDVGVDGPMLDQRIKLLFPGRSGRLPSLVDVGSDWYQGWGTLPDDDRPQIRTYTVRDLVGPPEDRRLLVDIVLHPGAHGPGSTWAASVRPGDPVGLVAPRAGVTFGGIEFDPGHARRILLVADETAVPAVAGILAGLPLGVPTTAFLEAPHAGDMVDLPVPPQAEVVWLPREGAPLGERVSAAVRDHLSSANGNATSASGNSARMSGHSTEGEVDPDVWETPIYSSSGADVEAEDAVEPAQPDALDGLYAWIAGESGVVTALRRHLVGDLGLHRRQVAFMGYWRQGVAMRS